MSPFSFQTFSLVILSLYTRFSTSSPAVVPGVVSFDFERRQVFDSDIFSRRLGKRAGEAPAVLTAIQQGTFYIINTTVGTPPQNVAVHLDTGSADFWVPGITSEPCRQGICHYGAYDITRSSSVVVTAPNKFSIGYGDGTQIAGDYINETITVAGATLQNVIMAVASEAEIPDGLTSLGLTGIMGVSYNTDESIAEGNQGYPNVVSQLVVQEVISTRAFSLWLNDLEAGTGSVLFGGVDSTKYTGDLVALPLQVDPVENRIHSFLVTFAGLEVDGNGGKTVYSANSSMLTLLDSATTQTYIPVDMYEALFAGLGAVNTTNGAFVPCSLANSEAELKFKFGNAGGPVITAKLSQFLQYTGPGLNFANGEAACALAINPQSDDTLIFGENFLRAAYLVYNIDGDQVAIANTNFNVTGSGSITQITAINSIPGVSSTASGIPSNTATTYGFPTGGGILYPDTASVFTQTATSTIWDLGTSSTSSSSTGSPKKGAASGLAPPSASFVGVIFTGMSVLFGLLGGSMIVLM